MSGPNPSPAPAAAGGWSPATVVLGLVVVLAVVIVVWNVASGNPKMSDGTDVTAPDPDLKVINSGVKYRDIKVGVGGECQEGSKAQVHYTGWLEDGTVFDSSRGGTKAVDVDLAIGVIPGWREGVPGMKKGGVRKLVIAPEKAYGAKARGGIPANATLIFEIELVRFAEPSEPVIKARPRRSPLPTDLTKLSDGTLPTDDDKGLVPLGKDGLLIRELKVGDGEVVGHGAQAVMDYIGWRKADGVVFDSSFKRTETFRADLSSGLIRGWMEGVPGMKVGGVRKLVIPADLAYGAGGRPPQIPGGAALVFEIEVLGTR